MSELPAGVLVADAQGVPWLVTEQRLARWEPGRIRVPASQEPDGVGIQGVDAEVDRAGNHARLPGDGAFFGGDGGTDKGKPSPVGGGPAPPGAYGRKEAVWGIGW